MPDVLRENTVLLSDFEADLIRDFRSLLDHGFGVLHLEVHRHALAKFEATKKKDLSAYEEFALNK